jgi:hypothetical protein
MARCYDAQQYGNRKMKAKGKPGYWARKLQNMRKAKALRPVSRLRRELREEEAWRTVKGTKP